MLHPISLKVKLGMNGIMFGMIKKEVVGGTTNQKLRLGLIEEGQMGSDPKYDIAKGKITYADNQEATSFSGVTGWEHSVEVCVKTGIAGPVFELALC